MYNATLTSKGQTTIPKEIRDALAMQPGTRMNFSTLSDGTVVMRVKSRPIQDLVGVSGYPGPKLSMDALQAWRKAA